MAKKEINREMFVKAGRKGGKSTVKLYGNEFLKKIAIEREAKRKEVAT